MDDEEVLIISSSPEPEQETVIYSAKGKGRARNRESVNLTLGNDDIDPTVYRTSRISLKTSTHAMRDAHDMDGPSGMSRDSQPVASGSGVTDNVQVLEDPIEATMKQVLDVIPNVEPEHLRSLVLLYQSQDHEDVGTAIISQLLENPDYPKSTGKRKVTTDDDQSSNKRIKVDYLAPDREAMADVAYTNLSLDYLTRIDFPTIPRDYIKRMFFKEKQLYAPTFVALKQDLEEGSKFTPKKTTKRAAASRGKAKAIPESEDFERERQWLLQYLDEKAELAECEQNGTGVECGCCFGDYPFSWMVQCPDAHLFCRDCARRSAEECIGNRKTELLCMDQSGCKLPFAESEVQRFLSEKSLGLWYRIKQEREIELAQIDGLESCPFCSYAVVIENEQERLFRCESASCGVVSCRKCKKEDHLPKTCEEAEKDKVLDARHAVEEAMTKALMRNCPKCGQNFVKESGCNKMTCPKCRSLSCYVCRSLINGYEHFDQTPQGAPRRGQSSKCPLWDLVDQRHADEVKKAAEAAQEEYLRLHPEINENDLTVDVPPAPPAPAPAPALAYPHAYQPMQLARLGPPLAYPFPLPMQPPGVMPHNPVQQANFLQQAALQYGLHYRGMAGLDPQQNLNMEAERARLLRAEHEAALQREAQLIRQEAQRIQQEAQQLQRMLAEREQPPRGRARQQAAVHARGGRRRR